MSSRDLAGTTRWLPPHDGVAGSYETPTPRRIAPITPSELVGMGRVQSGAPEGSSPDFVAPAR